MVRDKRILITGGCGFIGTHVALRLAEHNRLTLLDIDTDNCLSLSALAGSDSIRVVRGDVRDVELIDREIADCDIILHYASLIGVKHVIANARETIDTIILGTRNVLEAAARRAGEIDRLVYISTSEVYGNIMNAEEGAAASVGTHNEPRLSYASAKLMGEHQVWAYHRDFGIPTVIVRPFNVFGPLRTASHAIGLFVVKALAGSDLTLFGDGSQLRSWCYVDDFVDAMLGCIENAEAAGEDFNLGNPRTAVTIYDLADRIIRLAGSSSRITTTEHTFSDIGVRAPNSVKARDLLGYVPAYDMDQALVPTIEWYRANLDRFDHWR